MALVPCPECKSRISDQAAACPRCGAPTSGLVRAPEVPKRARRSARRWGFDAALVIGVSISLVTIYGRWHDRQRAASEFKCWTNLNEIQRDTYLSLAPPSREQLNYGTCFDAGIFLTQLAGTPKQSRDLAVLQALIQNHGNIPSGMGRPPE